MTAMNKTLAIAPAAPAPTPQAAPAAPAASTDSGSSFHDALAKAQGGNDGAVAQAQPPGTASPQSPGAAQASQGSGSGSSAAAHGDAAGGQGKATGHAAAQSKSGHRAAAAQDAAATPAQIAAQVVAALQAQLPSGRPAQPAAQADPAAELAGLRAVQVAQTSALPGTASAAPSGKNLPPRAGNPTPDATAAPPADAAAAALAALGAAHGGSATPGGGGNNHAGQGSGDAQARVAAADVAPGRAAGAAAGSVAVHVSTAQADDAQAADTLAPLTAHASTHGADQAAAAQGGFSAVLQGLGTQATAGVAPQPAQQAAAQSTYTGTLASQVGTPAWGQDLGQQMLFAVDGQKQFATLHLNPPQLGPLEVRVQMQDGQVNAQFVSPHQAVRSAIESAMPQLRDMFTGSGLNLAQTSVNSGQSGDAGAQQRQPRSRGTAAASADDAAADLAAVGSTPLAWQRGLVNTFV